MRAELIRIYKSVHTWTGIMAGLALFIAFYAGALTIFKEPITRWAAPIADRAFVPLEETPARIIRLLQTHPEAAKDFRLHLKQAEHLSSNITWQVWPEGADDHDASGVRHYIAVFDGAGAVSVQEVQPSRLAEFIDTLHRVVGLPVDSDANRWIMGVIAAIYALALVSGVIIFLPALVSDFLAMRLGKNIKLFWRDAHNAIGIASLPFHIVMVLTAAVFAFHDQIYAIQDRLIHDGKWSSAYQRPAPLKNEPRDPALLLPPAELLAKVKAFSPGFEPTGLQYLDALGPRAMVRVWGSDPSTYSPRFMGGFAVLDPYSGKIMTNDFMPGKQGAAHAVVYSFFALHFGTYGGAPVQWIYFLLGLAGAFLFYTGNLLWVESRRRKQEAGASRSVNVMAALTAGVSLGCIAGISLSIAAGKWLHGYVDDLNAWHMGIYYAAFFAAIAWAFARGAAGALPQLLWFAAIATALIPLASLIAVLIPDSGLWAHTSAAALGVDFVAAIGALIFARSAVKVSK